MQLTETLASWVAAVQQASWAAGMAMALCSGVEVAQTPARIVVVPASGAAVPLGTAEGGEKEAEDD